MHSTLVSPEDSAMVSNNAFGAGYDLHWAVKSLREAKNQSPPTNKTFTIFINVDA